MDISQKLRMRFYEFQNKLRYEPVEIKYHFKDLQCLCTDNGSAFIPDTQASDLLRSEKIYGILSRSKVFNNIAFSHKPHGSIKQRILKRISLPNGGQLDNDFDERGRLIRTHYPDDISMIYHYNDLGYLSYIKSTNDITIDLNYDTRGRITKIKHSKEGVLEYIWGHSNSLESVKYPDSSKVFLKWDNNNRLIEIEYISDVSEYVEMRLENFQNIIKSKTEKIAFDRDKTGSLIGVMIDDIFNYEFSKDNDKKIFDVYWIKDDKGKVIKVITPTGIFLLDEDNRIKTQIGIDGQVKIYRHDKYKNLESIWDIGGITLFEIYNDKSSSIVNSSGLRTLRVTDSERPIVYMIEPFGVSMENYDEEKKMITLVNDKGVRVIYKYDKKGWLTSIYNPIIGETRFAYTRYGLLKDIVVNSNIRIEFFYLKKELFSGLKIHNLSDIYSDFLLIFLVPIMESIISKKVQVNYNV